MAYKRFTRYQRRRNYGRKKTSWLNKRYSVGQMAQKALSGVSYLRGLVNSETQHAILTASGNINSSGSITHLTGVGQGDDKNHRTGRSILARSLYMNMQIDANAAATFTHARIIVFMDTQQIADTNPTITDVLNSAHYLSLLNPNSGGRFKVLKNWQITLDASTRNSITLTKYFKLYNHVLYNGSNGADIQKNGIYVLLISNQVTNTPAMEYNFNLGFHDN